MSFKLCVIQVVYRYDEWRQANKTKIIILFCAYPVIYSGSRAFTLVSYNYINHPSVMSHVGTRVVKPLLSTSLEEARAGDAFMSKTILGKTILNLIVVSV